MGFPGAVVLAIKNELLTDPATVGYAGKTPAQQAGLMNLPRPQSPRVFVQTPVVPQVAALYLIKQAKWEPIVSAANTPAAAGHAAAFQLVELSKLGNAADSFEGPELRALLTALQAASLIVGADMAAIRDLSRSEVLVSRAQVVGVDSVTADNVREALNS